MPTSLHKVWASICFIWLAGCGQEAGIIIEVTREAETTPADIDRLRFFLGVRADTQRFLEDPEPLEEVELAGGRDLLDDPYALLLRDGTEDELGPDVLVAVVALAGGEPVGYARLDQPVPFVSGKVVRWTVTLRGDADFQVTDTGCVVWENGQISSRGDVDCDGDPAADDCNDEDPLIGPSRPEKCDNGIDDNCVGGIDEEIDADGDQVTNCAGDCDDTDPNVYPGAAEKCDGLDNNCDGACDDGFDVDGDRYTVCGSKLEDDGTCHAPDPSKVDCADDDASAYPGADELCDGVDNDCNEVCDDGWDPDGDTFTECGSVVSVCDGTNAGAIDCEPEDMNIHPGAPERCNGVDDDCDGMRHPASAPCFAIHDEGEPQCYAGVATCNDADGGDGWAACVPNIIDEAAVPGELCTAYDACLASDVPDPHACALEMTGARAGTCSLFYSGVGAPCPNLAALIPSTNRPGCAWQIVGGGTFGGHYALRFGSDSSPVTATDTQIATCGPWLHVVEVNDAPPHLDSALLWHTDADVIGSLLVHLRIIPTFTASCGENGLVCDFDLPMP